MEEDISIFDSNHWKVILHPDQAYLGRCVIPLKRKCGKLSEIRDDELLDFHSNIVKKLEYSISGSFGAKVFNYSCLMNNAFRIKTPDPQVHWHLRPRYDKEVYIDGILFRDSEFGEHYSRERKQIVSKETLMKISEKIKRYLVGFPS